MVAPWWRYAPSNVSPEGPKAGCSMASDAEIRVRGDAVSFATRRRVVWSAWCLSVTGLVAALALSLWHDAALWWILAWGIPLIGCSSVGLLICLRVPGNPIGWIFLGIGLAQGVGFFCDAYAARSLGLPGAAGVAVVAGVLEGVPPPLLPLLLMLFPQGRLASARWRSAYRVAIANVVVWTLTGPLLSGSLNLKSDPSQQNPIAVSGAIATADTVIGLASVAVLIGMMVGALAALAWRFRRASGELRQQLKWFAAAGALLTLAAGSWPLLWLVGAASPDALSNLAWVVAATATVAAMGTAILRYRLYEIDVIIRKTLVYASLIGCLAAVYAGGIYLIERALQAVSGQSGSFAVSASTLAVAVIFQPLRGRIQRAVDRRFYRRKYDAARILDAFSSRRREQVDLDALGVEVLDVVRATVQPGHVSLWLRRSEPAP